MLYLHESLPFDFELFRVESMFFHMLIPSIWHCEWNLVVAYYFLNKQMNEYAFKNHRMQLILPFYLN